YQIKELPISYYPRSVEEGKKIKWKDGLEAIWTLIKYRFTD
ncbi:MAG: glycosyltransferase family 2 protein, partial [Nanoarchaeota archaeon]